MTQLELGTGMRFRIGRLFGIPLFITLWFVLLFGYYLLRALVYEGSLASSIWIVTLVVIIVLHEMGHATAARRYGHVIHGITLHLFGGVMEHSGPRGSLAQRVVISLSGPAVHLVLLGIALPLWLLLPAPHPLLRALLEAMVWLNPALLIFNLLPIYPLDGGQVSRAVLVRRLGEVRGVVVASVVALVFAGCAMAFAVATRSFAMLGLVLLGLLAYTNYQELQRYRELGRSMGLSRWRPFAFVDEWRRRLRVRKLKGASVDELIVHARRHGLSSLGPEERRALVWHRTMLEERVRTNGYESLSQTEQDQLAEIHLLSRAEAGDN